MGYPEDRLLRDISLSAGVMVKRGTQATFLWTQKSFKFFDYYFSNFKFCPILPGAILGKMGVFDKMGACS